MNVLSFASRESFVAQRRELIANANLSVWSVSKEQKRRDFQRPVVRELLRNLPVEIQKKFAHAFFSGDYFGQDGMDVFEYVATNSDIGYAIAQAPGAAEAFHYLYTKESHSAIDEYYVNAPSGSQIRNRLYAMVRELPRIIRAHAKKGEMFLVDNLCSGQGYDMIFVLRDNPDLRDFVHVRNIDHDPIALQRGELLVRELGLEKCFSFECKEVFRASRRKAKAVIFSGVVCPIVEEAAPRPLSITMHYVEPSGIILYNATTTNMIAADSVTDFLMRIHGWAMDFKSINVIWNLAGEAGWIPIEKFFEGPDKFNCMVLAQKPDLS